MSVEYLGKVSNIVTTEELSSICGVKEGVVLNSGDIYFLKFVENDTTFLVSSKTLMHSLSWDYLNSIGCVFGKTIHINNIAYKVRLLKGSSGDEWDKFIVSHTPSASDSWWSTCLNYCQEDSPSSNLSIVSRGKESVSYLTYSNKSAVSNALGWRPVLEVLKPLCKFSIDSSNIGYVSEWSNVIYSIIGDSHSISEKLDGTIIRTLENQTSGTEYNLDLSLQWDNLSYGKHIIDIVATDTNGLSSSVTITFNKAKEPITTIPTTSSLKQAIAHNKEIEKEIDYQLLRFENALDEKGVELLPSDRGKLSSLIDKVGDTIGKGSIIVDNMISVISMPKDIIDEFPQAPSKYSSTIIMYDDGESAYYRGRYNGYWYVFKINKDGSIVWEVRIVETNISGIMHIIPYMDKLFLKVTATEKLYKLNPNTGEITSMQQMTHDFFVVRNNYLYGVAGYMTVSKYDLDSEQRISSGSLPSGSYNNVHSFCAFNNCLVLVNSKNGNGALSVFNDNAIFMNTFTDSSYNNVIYEFSTYAIRLLGNELCFYDYIDSKFHKVKSISIGALTEGSTAKLNSTDSVSIYVNTSNSSETSTYSLDENGNYHWKVSPQISLEYNPCRKEGFYYLGNTKRNLRKKYLIK